MNHPKATRWLVIMILSSMTTLTLTGTPCPPYDSIKPCFCSNVGSGQTTVVCSGLRNSTELESVTESMKSMIIDRIMLLGSFQNSDGFEDNELEQVNGGERLPQSWLASSRVRELEVQDVKLSNCFLCNDPFDGQDDFLVSLVVTHSSLDGHLCAVCNTKTKAVTTRYLQKMKNLKEVDFSFNKLEIVAGNAFPGTMEQLNKIVLSNNDITKVYDNAFSNLNQLKELDLSYNRLTTLTRKMFRPSDTVLQSLDVSWNSIQHLPDDMFNNLRALKEIKMSHNLLEVLSVTTFSRLNIQAEKIDVKGNFLVCNCSLSWINGRLSKSTKIVGKCVAPKETEFHDVKPTLATLQGCK